MSWLGACGSLNSILIVLMISSPLGLGSWIKKLPWSMSIRWTPSGRGLELGEWVGVGDEEGEDD
jgi:hypothetical protein